MLSDLINSVSHAEIDKIDYEEHYRDDAQQHGYEAGLVRLTLIHLQTLCHIITLMYSLVR